jgi:hypothetical protein
MTMQYCQTCSVGNAEMQGNRHSVALGARVIVRRSLGLSQLPTRLAESGAHISICAA